MSDDTQDDGPARVFYEKRKYPLLPEGTYKVICAKAELKDANPTGEYYHEGDKNIILRWEVRDATYVDPEDEEQKDRHFQLFNRPLSLAFGERSNLGKLFLRLTGKDVQNYVDSKPMRIAIGNGKFKEGLEFTFDHRCLENMECSVAVEHTEWKGEKRASIIAHSTTEQQRKDNSDILAPEYADQRRSSAKSAGDVAAELGGDAKSAPEETGSFKQDGKGFRFVRDDSGENEASSSTVGSEAAGEVFGTGRGGDAQEESSFNKTLSAAKGKKPKGSASSKSRGDDAESDGSESGDRR